MDDSLTSFIEEVTGDSHLRVEDDLGDGYVRLRSSEAERRQAKHDIRCSEDIVIEMLRNARDANARHIFLALSREGNNRRICMIDDGVGIPANMQEEVFKPRVTSKLDSMHVDKWGVHGRGMALYSIAVNAEEARIAESSPGMGSSIIVVTNTEKLKEKSDQSSMPVFDFDDSGELVIRGPHNINRVVAEFAYESKDICTVFVGSITDIAATLFEFGEATTSKSTRMFSDSTHELPVVKKLCMAADAESLSTLCATIGLELSSRSARRILDGDIKPLAPVYETLSFKPENKEEHSQKGRNSLRKRLLKDARGLKLYEDDVEEFTDEIKKAYHDLAQKYYLESEVDPEIKLTSSDLIIKIPLGKLR